jgi:predicted transcriptional regulator
MSSDELKEKLIAKINNINDRELLELIARTIEFEEKYNVIYEMSSEELAAVQEGREQLKKGQWLSHEEANKQVDEWFNQHPGS